MGKKRAWNINKNIVGVKKMNGKSPISTLQELMAAQKCQLPVYIEEGFGTTFKCTVHAGGITAVGSGSSKKVAKHESAKKALDVMRSLYKPQVITNISRLPPSFTFKNYVGELNEFASQKGWQYPEYDSIPVMTSGEFLIKCSFLNHVTIGSGLNKKDAKQVAARQMLELINKKQPSSVIANEAYKVVQQKGSMQVADKEKIIEMYKQLSLNEKQTAELTSPSHKFTCLDGDIPDVELGNETIETLRDKLKSYCIKYTLEEFQKTPCIMRLKINGTNLDFMAFGENREEATKKLFYNVLSIKKSGFPLNDDLISFS